MIRRALLGLIAALVLPAAAMAQEATPAPLPRVIMQTSAGTIVIEVNDQAAPMTGS
ncbi:MAG: peptidylprolyl isomerase, partial [Brevundimonas sp.]